MKRILTVALMFLAGVCTAGSPYYDLSLSTSTGQATMKLSGKLNIARSSSTASTPVIEFNPTLGWTQMILKRFSITNDEAAWVVSRPYGTLSATNPSWHMGLPAANNVNWALWSFDGSSYVPRLTVQANTGYLGIGTTDPQATLDLGGGSLRLGGVTRSAWQDINTASDNTWTGNNTYTLPIRHNGVWSAGGNARGVAAVDLQTARADDTQVASGDVSTIGGGASNKATGFWSTVPGGLGNSAGGNYSFAGGYNATSSLAGSFTWAGLNGTAVTNDVARRTWFAQSGGFLVTASSAPADGGLYVSSQNYVGIGTLSPRSALDVAAGGITLGGVTKTEWPGDVSVPLAADNTWTGYNTFAQILTSTVGVRAPAFYTTGTSNRYRGSSKAAVMFYGSDGLAHFTGTTGVADWSAAFGPYNSEVGRDAIVTRVTGQNEIAGFTTFYSSAAFLADSFSVGDSTFVVKNGFVGVGMSPENPDSRLQVLGQIRSSGTASSIIFGDRSNSAHSWEWYSSGDTAGLYKNHNTAGTVLYAAPSGNIGMGTASPVKKLHIHSTIADSHLYVSGTGPGILFGDNESTGSNTYYAVQAMATTAGQYGSLAAGDYIIAAGNNIYITANYQASGKHLILQPTSGPSSVGGYVGIGTVSPAKELHVQGTIRQTAATNCEAALNASGDLVCSSSDRRLKTDITDLSVSTSAVDKLRPVTFTWDPATEYGAGMSTATKLGLIAQEVEEAIPLAVSTQGNGYKTVDYNALTAVLVQEIQRLRRRIEILEAK